MPPLYDDIVDAFELVADSASHSHDFDNTGATMETNESTDGEGFQGVWAKFHIDPALVWGDVTSSFADAVISGTVTPYVDFYAVIDATFDPASPDFSKLHYLPGAFLGDGTTTPPTKTPVFADSFFPSVTGWYYLWIGDWNFDPAAEGVQRITWTITPPAPPPPPPAGPDPYLQARFPTV